MNTKESIDIIKNLPLLDKSDSNVTTLAEKLDVKIRDLQETANEVKSFTSLNSATIKFKNSLKKLTDRQEKWLLREINQRLYLQGADEYTDVSIIDMLTIIEKCSIALVDEFSQKIETKGDNKKTKKLTFLDYILDDLGGIYFEATGKTITRDSDSKKFIKLILDLAELKKPTVSYAARSIADRVEHRCPDPKVIDKEHIRRNNRMLHAMAKRTNQKEDS